MDGFTGTPGSRGFPFQRIQGGWVCSWRQFLTIRFFNTETVSRALAIIIFIILTTPVSAHVIARVAYLVGIPMWGKSIIGEFDQEFEAGS